MFNADVIIDSSLIDPKKHLMGIDGVFQTVQPLHLLLASYQPTCGPVYRILYVCAVCYTGGALVKGHSNGGCQIRLDLHALLRSHENLPSVNVGLEINPLLLYLAEACKGEDLKSTGICQDRPVPIHKLMEAPHLLYDLISRTHMEMVRIGKLHLCPDLPQVCGGNRTFNRRSRAHIHKKRSLDRSVYGRQLCPFCHSIPF